MVMSVDFLEEDGSYAMVRLANGKEGWMLKRYLTTDPPLANVVASLRAENEKLKQKELELTQKFSEVSANLSKIETNLQSTLNEKNQIATDYQTLQQDTADVIKIKEDMLKATEQRDVLTEEITALKEENARLDKDKSDPLVLGWRRCFAGRSVSRQLVQYVAKKEIITYVRSEKQENFIKRVANIFWLINSGY